MATVGEAIAATLIAQWTAAGGAQPDPIQYLVERPERDPNPTVADAVYVWLPLRRKFDPVDIAGTYRDVTYTIRVVCHTKTSSARQKEIENEVDRILNSGTVITGATKQTVKEINDISNRSYSVLPKYISEVIVEVFTAMEVSATAYGTGTTSTFETDELTVNTSIAGSPTAALGATTITGDVSVTGDVKNAGNITLKSTANSAIVASAATKSQYFDCGSIFQWRDVDDTYDLVMSLDTATGALLLTKNDYSINEALMLGSANKAYVPCSFMGAAAFADVMVTYGVARNVGANDMKLAFLLPKPCNKGSLKLYISNAKYGLGDADEDDFINTVVIYGDNGNAQTQLDIDNTNHSTAGDKTFSGAVMPAAAIDCSGYQSVYIYIACSNTGAQHLDLGNIRMECYYA